jgi:hypothetical protein
MSRTLFFRQSHSCRNFTEAEQMFILRILNDAKAWPFHWRLAENDSCDWAIALETNHYIEIITNTSNLFGLSVTFMSKRPRVTYFSFENWTSVPKPIATVYSKKDYRTYLILHECGHSLGLGHRILISKQKVPIMYQATKGISDSIKNIWPLDYELKSV